MTSVALIQRLFDQFPRITIKQSNGKVIHCRIVHPSTLSPLKDGDQLDESCLLNGANPNDNSIVLALCRDKGEGGDYTASKFGVMKLPLLKYLNQNDFNCRKYLKKRSESLDHETTHINRKLRKSEDSGRCIYCTRLLASGEIDLTQFGKLRVVVHELLTGMTPLSAWRSKHGDRLPPNQWIQIALGLSRALSDLHSRRVTHGDVWEPNIFVEERGDRLHVKMIDFSDAFAGEFMSGEWRNRRHIYLAPERLTLDTYADEASDVYSFGITLISLATKDGLMNSTKERDIIFGKSIQPSRRLEKLRRFIGKDGYNQYLAKEHANLIDIVGKCTSYAASDRPQMHEVVQEIDALMAQQQGFGTRNLVPHLQKFARKVHEFSQQLGSKQTLPPVLLNLVQRQFNAMDRMIDNLKWRSMLDIEGSRKKLVSELSIMLRTLDNGDSWSAISSLHSWQDRAFGYCGEVITENILAIDRNARINRALVVPISMIDKSTFKIWMEELELLSKNVARKFRAAVTSNNERYEIYQEDRKEQQPRSSESGLLMRAGRRILKQFVQVATAFATRIEERQLLGMYDTIAHGKAGFYLSIIPVSEVWQSNLIRWENPFVLMWKNDIKKWLLVRGEIRSRSFKDISEPDIVSLRAFVSALKDGIPVDRIDRMHESLQGSVSASADDWALLKSAKLALKRAGQSER